MSYNIKTLAFYLPQYHPIPENDKWWGKGFTEWTNVAKAKPLYKGHNQPIIPKDLGFYDLRVSETREAQAELAKKYGVSCFCYWHYWFGMNKRLLNRPFDEVVKSKKPDFPFCLAWANQTWTGHWHGQESDILIEQTYGGVEDYKAHFEALKSAFIDQRYFKIDNKPVFLVYNPRKLPNTEEFTSTWSQLAIENGLDGFYFIAIDKKGSNPSDFHMNATTWHEPKSHEELLENKIEKLKSKIGFESKPTRINYSDYIELALNFELKNTEIPMVLPNWDNTPRSQKNGLVFESSSPELFQKLFQKAVDIVKNRPQNERLIIVKSWNEWAEGNILEPDHTYDHGYLQAIKNCIL